MCIWEAVTSVLHVDMWLLQVSDMWGAAGLQEDPFTRRNRLSLPGSLHRVSAMKGDSGRIHGLTYRIGRHMPGQHTHTPSQSRICSLKDRRKLCLCLTLQS